jgi:hypothetical protein
MAGPAKTVVDALREIAQDILVPELKSLKVSLDALRTETHLGDERLQESVNGLREEMKLRDERLHSELRLRDERMQESVRTLSQKLDFAIDIRERLAALEARLPRQ